MKLCPVYRSREYAVATATAIYTRADCSYREQMLVSTRLGAGTGALDKGLALLAYVVRDAGKTSLSAVAQELELPQSTARRLAASLERHQLIARVGRGRYAAGAGLAALSQSVQLRDVMARVARAPLRRLARTLRATTHLGVLEGDMVTYLVKERYGKDMLFTREQGQLEAYCSGMGKVLLAAQAPAVRRTYLAAGDFIALTDRTIIDPNLLDRELDKVARLGVAIDDEEVADGLYCAAVPIRDRVGNVLAAISVSGRPDTLRQKEFTGTRDTLNQCAQAIEACL